MKVGPSCRIPTSIASREALVARSFSATHFTVPPTPSTHVLRVLIPPAHYRRNVGCSNRWRVLLHRCLRFRNDSLICITTCVTRNESVFRLREMLSAGLPREMPPLVGPPRQRAQRPAAADRQRRLSRLPQPRQANGCRFRRCLSSGSLGRGPNGLLQRKAQA